MTANTDLNAGLARLMGFDYAQTSDEISDEPLYRVVGPDGQPLTDARWWVSREFANHAIPPFSRSLDALFAPGGPVEYATSKGMSVTLHTNGGEWRATVEQFGVIDLGLHVFPDPAEALATALHEALSKEAGV